MDRYKLDVVGVQEVRWDRGGTKRKSSIGNRIFVHHRIVWAVNRVVLVLVVFKMAVVLCALCEVRDEMLDIGGVW